MDEFLEVDVDGVLVEIHALDIERVDLPLVFATREREGWCNHSRGRDVRPTVVFNDGDGEQRGRASLADLEAVGVQLVKMNAGSGWDRIKQAPGLWPRQSR